MSPRAACRLELLGFTRVYDYVAGEADWLAHGLPTEGTQAQVPRAKDVLRSDAVTARPEEPVGQVVARVARSPCAAFLRTWSAGWPWSALPRWPGDGCGYWETACQRWPASRAGPRSAGRCRRTGTPPPPAPRPASPPAPHQGEAAQHQRVADGLGGADQRQPAQGGVVVVAAARAGSGSGAPGRRSARSSGSPWRRSPSARRAHRYAPLAPSSTRQGVP
jgi:hypothetical protein